MPVTISRQSGTVPSRHPPDRHASRRSRASNNSCTAFPGAATSTAATATGPATFPAISTAATSPATRRTKQEREATFKYTSCHVCKARVCVDRKWRRRITCNSCSEAMGFPARELAAPAADARVDTGSAKRRPRVDLGADCDAMGRAEAKARGKHALDHPLQRMSRNAKSYFAQRHLVPSARGSGAAPRPGSGRFSLPPIA